jgi:S-formylglutathione hydrolase
MLADGGKPAMLSQLERFQVLDPLHGLVRCTSLAPPSAEPSSPLCFFLYGGGGSAESLADIQPLLDQEWAAGRLPPLRLVTPDVGAFSFYLDDPARGFGWESFVATRLLDHVRRRFQPSALGLLGISMGGYGALKIAFARPETFSGVAAISPMLEPAFDADQVGARNRHHYPSDVPAALLGAPRDPDLYRRDTPVNRARQYADALRQSGLAIYLDAAGQDALNAHDGAEFLHRTLWQLDLAHEYRLRRDADHAGPDFVARLLEAFRWLGSYLAPLPAAELSEPERAWEAWLDGRAPEPLQPLAPDSPLFPRLLRARLAEPRRLAALEDPTVFRRYGVL